MLGYTEQGDKKVNQRSTPKLQFKSKNLCDKSLKIKNLRWQFSCIFHWLRRGILRFFCRCRYHGDICRSKSPVLQNSEKDEKWAFLYGKIRPLEMIFFAFFPAHLLSLSERFVLYPQTLMEIKIRILFYDFLDSNLLQNVNSRIPVMLKSR